MGPCFVSKQDSLFISAPGCSVLLLLLGSLQILPVTPKDWAPYFPSTRPCTGSCVYLQTQGHCWRCAAGAFGAECEGAYMADHRRETLI